MWTSSRLKEEELCGTQAAARQKAGLPLRFSGMPGGVFVDWGLLKHKISRGVRLRRRGALQNGGGSIKLVCFPGVYPFLANKSPFGPL